MGTKCLGRWWGGAYFRRCGSERVPVQPREDVDDHVGVQLQLILHELCVFGMEGVRVRGGFAGFDCAGQEIEGEYFHFDCEQIFSIRW